MNTCNLTPLLLILALLLVFLMFSKQSKITMNVNLLLIILVIGSVLVYLYMTYAQNISLKLLTGGLLEGFQNNTPSAGIDYVMGKCDALNVNQITTDLPLKMANLELPYAETNHELLNKDKVVYHSPNGIPYNLCGDKFATTNYPTVDGTKGMGAPQRMFMMAFNESKPECCPGTFSSSRGCVCLTNDQKHMINSRGGNKTANGNPDF